MTEAVQQKGKRRVPWVGALAICCIALQFGGRLHFSLLALVIWLTTLAIVDRITLRRMWMPRFWLITLIVATVSGFLLGPRDIELFGLNLSRYGMEAGGLMIVRGAFIFGLVIWSSRNLNMEHIRRLSKLLKAERLYMSAEVALRMIPMLRDRLGVDYYAFKREEAKPRSLGGLYRFILKTFVRTAQFADGMAKRQHMAEMSKGKAMVGKTEIIAITGPRSQGKTTMISGLVKRLKSRGLHVAGVIQVAVFENDEKIGYDLVDIEDGLKRPIARKREKVKPGEIGHRFFDENWAWARERIVFARKRAQVVVVDELGLLEARGEGHLPSLTEDIGKATPAVFLLGVRESCLNEIELRLGRFDRVGIASEQESATDEFEQFIFDSVNAKEKESDSDA